MADVKIRNLPDWLVDWHKRRAEAAGISLEEHLRQALHTSFFENRRRLAAELDRHCDRIQARTGILPDSTPLIREAREEVEAKFNARPGRKRVAVKWLVPEERRPEARALLESDLVLSAPSVIVSEVATGISRKARLRQISTDEATLAMDQWLTRFSTDAALDVHPDRDLLRDALELSLELDHQLPDCLYLALARKLGAPLVTADEKLIRKVAPRNDLRLVRLGADPNAGSGGRR